MVVRLDPETWPPWGQDPLVRMWTDRQTVDVAIEAAGSLEYLQGVLAAVTSDGLLLEMGDEDGASSSGQACYLPRERLVWVRVAFVVTQPDDVPDLNDQWREVRRRDSDEP